jgi:hypothetical protein
MTPQDVITEARVLLQDNRVPFRYSDTVLTGFVNQTIRRMVMLRPDLFVAVVDISTTPNVAEQLLPPVAVRLVEIFRVKGGTSIEEVDRDVFDRSYPQWTTDPAGTPTKYIRHPRNPRAYFLYPRPAAGIVLVGEYVTTPPNYLIGQNIDALPDAYLPALIDGTVYLAESVDNEHVNSGRAKLFLDSFGQSLGISLQSRAYTDTESSGISDERSTDRRNDR